MSSLADKRIDAFKELIDFTFSKLNTEDCNTFSLYLNNYMDQVHKHYMGTLTVSAIEFNKFIENLLE